MNRQPAAHPDPYDEAPSAARQRGDRRAERKTRKRRNVPPARTWTDVADMPQFGITLPEAAQFVGISYAGLWALAAGGQIESAIRSAGEWESGMLVRRGSRWHMSRAAVQWLATHDLPHVHGTTAKTAGS